MTGQQMIDKWIAFFRKYVVLTEQQALVVALWAITSWVSDHFQVQPYMEIVASTKRSGKTTLLDCLALVTRNAQQFATVRVLTIVRIIAALESRCTILIDEAEQLGKSGVTAGPMADTRSCLATGYRAGASHAISVGQKIIKFPTSCMKAFAQIGNVHGVLRDRCIEIELQRGKPERVLSEWRDVAEAEAAELVAELVQFSKGVERWGITPAEWLHARERELWTPLVSVAHTLGLHADTIRQLQAASVDLGLLKLQPPKEYHSAQDEQDADERDAAERVLTDLRSILQPGEAFISSAQAVDRLRAIPTAPWRAWHGSGLNEIALAALLARYGIEPKQKRVSKAKKGADTRARGYLAADLQRAE